MPAVPIDSAPPIPWQQATTYAGAGVTPDPVVGPGGLVGPITGPGGSAPPAPPPVWYSPAPAPPQAAPAVAAAPDPTAAPPDPAAATAPTVPPPFAQDFPAPFIQAPGAFVAPIGGTPGHVSSGLGFAGGGLLTVRYAPISAWSQSDGGQLDGLFSPHTSYRAGLGGIGRVLAGLGLAGHHKLPRELERHAATRTPLTP